MEARWVLVFRKVFLLLGLVFAGHQYSFAQMPAPDQWYRIVPKHSGLYLDVYEISTKNGANIVQWDLGCCENQHFKFIEENGFYRILARHSNKYLDVQGISKESLTPVIQWERGCCDNQLFKLIPRGDGYFQIQAKHSGKCWDVEGVRKDRGAKLLQYDCHTGDNQQFRLVPVKVSQSSQPSVGGNLSLLDDIRDKGSNGLPKPGDTRVEEVKIYLRVKDKPQPDLFDQTYEPDPGWQIIKVDIGNPDRLGDTSGPSVVKVQSNSRTISSQSVREEQKSLFDFLSEKQAKAEAAGQGGEFYAKLKLKLQEEMSSLAQRSSTYSSNNYGVRITARAQAVWDTVLGQRFYKSGGKLETTVKITVMYIGSQSYLEERLKLYKELAR